MKTIEDLYPLSPAQEGILFHTLYSQGSGVYVEQFSCVFDEALDAGAFDLAWRRALRDHPSLRTSFLWDQVDRPLQVVHRKAEVSLEQGDWRELSHAEQEERFEQYLKTDREKGFDPTQAPLMRLHLIRIGERAYRFVWSFHHLLLDGWSMCLVLDQVFTAYEAIREGKEITSRGSRPYKDYIAWLQREDRSESEAFWSRSLAGFTTPTSLGIVANQSTDAVASGFAERYQSVRSTLSTTVASTLDAAARTAHLSIGAIAQAAWALLLSRYSDEFDVVFGVALSGRPSELEGSDEMVGLFINTLPLRVSVDDTMTALTLAGRVQEAQAALQQHQTTPLVEIQRLGNRRGGQSLFDSLLIIENFPVAETLLRRRDSLKASQIRFSETANYPITAKVFPGESLSFELNYDANRVGSLDAERMAAHFLQLLERIASEPDCLICDLPLLSPTERHRLLVELNKTEASYPKDRCIHQLFAEQAARTPARIALACDDLNLSDDSNLSYAGLDRESNRLARYLCSLGVNAEARVAICLPRGVEMVTAVLAVLKAGAAYVPLDPSHPAERLSFILKDSGARLLLTSGAAADGFAPPELKVVSIDRDRHAIELERSDDLECAVTPDHLAYTIYTSGSTGRPKGVQITHRSVVNFLDSMRRTPGLEPEDVLVSVTTLSFDIAGLELLLPISIGAKTIVASTDVAADGARLGELLTRSGATVMQATPSRWRLLLESDWSGDDNFKALCGGEALPPTLAEELVARGGEVWNLYGPTETTIWSTIARIESSNCISIGRPISNTQIYLLDSRMNPVPTGIPGDLYIGGDGVGRGYLNRPDLTATAFVPDPFTSESGARFYRTGDRARYLDDGRIEYQGRSDHQAKVRGFRVEPGEIETVLSEHNAIQQAVVIVREDSTGAGQLGAYLIAANGHRPDNRELRAFLRERLPEYMIPSWFVMLDSLPLTANGKVDRRSLSLDRPRDPGNESSESSASPIEEIITGIWSKLLDLDHVGRHDNFFEIGGHSLLATSSTSRVREAFGVDLPLSTIFNAPTAASLAERIEALLVTRVDAAHSSISKAAGEGPAPLSHAQRRMWFLNQLDPDSAAYNTPAALRLKGTLDIDVLKAGFGDLIKRHESLRTRFVTAGAEPAQVIEEDGPFDFTVVDLREHSPELRESEYRGRVREEALRPFDLSRLPLLRCVLFVLDQQEYLLLINMHHIISDGWSMRVLVREAAEIYSARIEQRPSMLEPLALQYEGYARWQKEWFESGVLEGQLHYWREQLAGVSPMLELPTDRPRPAVQSDRGERLPFEFSASLTNRLKALSNEESATLFMTLVGAFSVLLHRYTRQNDIAIGTPAANRNRSETEGLIGFLVNTLVIRADLSGDPEFREMLRRIRRTALNAYVHQDIPFEWLVEELAPERSLSHAPLFQVLFVLQDQRGALPELPSLSANLEDVDAGTSRFDLEIHVWESQTGLGGVMMYSSDLFEHATVARMTSCFETLIESILANPDCPISKLSILTDAEERRIITDWNETAADYESSVCIHGLFESQAVLAPDRTAIVFGDCCLSYDHLNRRANQLAHHLNSLGAAPEIRVAICVERSVEMLIAVLAVLKSGAGYIPLTPAYPRERLAFMLEDAGLLITDRQSTAILPDHHARVISLDSNSDFLRDGDRENFNSEAAADNLAYVIYTSGSTGRPKGVALSHRALLNLLCWEMDSSALEPGERTLQFSSITFDMSFNEAFSAWCSGGTLVLVSEEMRLDPRDLWAYIREQQVERLLLPYVALQQLAEQFEQGPSAIREVATSGEQLKISRQIEAMFTGLDATLENHYGPSESHVVTAHRLTGPPSTWPELPSIGRPIANSQIYILGENFGPLPVGVPGELFIGGDSLGRGYLNRPELTAERFIPNPFGASGARMYKSGDLSRFRDGGDIEFLGRIDHQVKIRGHRVELAEIDAVLGDHPSVAQSLTVALPNDIGEKMLVAYVAADPNEQVTVAQLREFTGRKLPDYMIPLSFVMLPALPVTENGKVDRRALPAPERLQSSDGDYEAPRTLTEQVLAKLWSDVLRLERAGIDDNFFAFGGHSLLATQLMSRIRSAFRAEIPLRALFSAPTIRGLSQAIDDALRATGPVRRITRQADSSEAPLSFAQQRLWFIDQLEPGNPFYNLYTVIEMKGRLDLLALERTLSEIIIRHEVLRTTFAEKDGGPVQVIGKPEPASIEFEDLTGVPAEAAEMEAMRLAGEETQRPFELGSGPLFRVRVFRIAHERHTAIFTMHHIISDGWSIGVLINEVAALYEAFSSGGISPLPELEIQYADFARWQREWLEDGALDQQLGYWRARLAGAPSVLSLPADRPRPAIKGRSGALHTIEIGPELTSSLGSLSRSNGSTLFMTLLAAFNALLSRYTHITDIVVGADVANRNRAETEALIGFFVNMLVLRTDLSGDPTFLELLSRTREICLGGYAHQDVPFEKLVEELSPERSLSYTPLFQVLFVLQNAPSRDLSLPGVELSALSLPKETANYDLLLDLSEDGDRLTGFLQYSTDLFDSSTIERMAGHLLNLIEGIVGDPSLSLSEFPVMSPAEIRHITVDWNDTRTDYPRDAVISELFEYWAGETSDSIAVICEDLSLTYYTLDRRANQLARCLHHMGVGPEVPVGLGVERGVEMLVAILAILKAGGAYVPLDPSYPIERLGILLEDARVPVLITQETLLDKFPVHFGRVVCLDSERDEIDRESDEPLPASAVADNLAYVIYTSGSTGRPKGVSVTHRGVVRLVRDTNYIQLGPEEVVVQLAPVTFDASTLEIWGSLLNGASLVIVKEHRTSIARIAQVLEEHAVTTMWLTAGLFHLMVDEALDRLAAARQLLAGGDILSPHHVRRYIEAAGNRVLINGYGPTENTTFTCTYSMNRETEFGATVPIGKPISNTRVYLLDPRLNVAPIGVSGELYTGGDGLARGYLNAPAQTAERFIPDALGTEGGRIYRTGDLARYAPDGRIEFLGRGDYQVKVRGFRIELGEIETMISRHPDVREAVVLARGDQVGDRRIIAYVTGKPDKSLVAADLKHYLKDRLPEYMVPGSIVPLDELPLTENGKVDRNRLPEPETYINEESKAPAAGLSPIEEVLIGMWENLLSARGIGLDEDFFELGGHSLLATQVVSRVRETFNVEMPLRQMFEHPTVREFGRDIEFAIKRGAGVEAPPILPVPREFGMPLSYSQQRLWFLDQLEPGSPFYNIHVGVRISGPLDANIFAASLREIVRRHEVLRTTFSLADGEPVQIIDAAADLDFRLVDLSELEGERGREEAARRANEEALTPFDLNRGPLLRVRVLRLGSEEHVALFTMHHIISDGWSLGVLVNEVAAIYPALASKGPSPLTDLPIQYADFAVWHREWLQGDVLDLQLAYWKSRLTGAPAVFELPTDRPRPAIQTYRGDAHTVLLATELAENLKALSRQQGVTLFMTLLAAWQTMLMRYTHQEDFVVGTPIANRNRAETEGLIGFFVNTLPMRTDLTGDPAFNELLGRVREITLGAYAHQDLPFERLVEELAPERSLSHALLFQVMFVLQNTPVENLELRGLSLSVMKSRTETAQFDLVLDMRESRQGLETTIEYNVDLFDASTIERMAVHLETLLHGVAANPTPRLSDMPLFSEQQLSQILIDWNNTRSSYPKNICLHELFLAQAEQRADSVAVVFDAEQVTYGELNRRSNKLARYLREMGLRPDCLAAICVERSIEMIVAVLGVLKSGGAYLPLDPAYPRERLLVMLEDSRAGIVITQQRLLAMIPEIPARVVCIDTDWFEVSSRADDNLEAAVTPGNLAYVIYTSGSTGKPKGVLIPHRAVVNHNFAVASPYQLTSRDRVLQFAALSFDVAVEEIFPTWMCGAAVVLLPESAMSSPNSFWKFLDSQRVTVVNLPTAFWNEIVSERASHNGNSRPALRVAAIGGEKGLLERFERAQEVIGPELRLMNVYGPTETTVTNTVYEWRPGSKPGGTSSVPLGRPIANTRMYIVDRHVQPVPIGAPGEVHISGDSMARGYLNRPDLTAEKFIPDPFSDEAGGRTYKTGDVGRLLEDSCIEFLGRVDQQVKVRGFRIELGEIEAVLRSHSDIREAVVVARDGGRGGKRVIGYVVAKNEQPPSIGELRAHVKSRLPEYMVPSVIISLEELPLTGNGKVDRARLPEPAQQRPELEEQYTPPGSPLEELLAQIWSQVLGIDRIGVHDDFFELGGHSLLATQLVSRVRDALSVELALRNLFESPTIAQLSQVVEDGLIKQMEQLSEEEALGALREPY